MLKIFVEYKVVEEKLQDYFQYTEQLRALYPRVRVYEGVHQPGLFVEEWGECIEPFFEMLKEERNEPDHPFWSRLDTLLVGGRAKAQLWLFREFV